MAALPLPDDSAVPTTPCFTEQPWYIKPLLDLQRRLIADPKAELGEEVKDLIFRMNKCLDKYQAETVWRQRTGAVPDRAGRRHLLPHAGDGLRVHRSSRVLMVQSRRRHSLQSGDSAHEISGKWVRTDGTIRLF